VTIALGESGLLKVRFGTTPAVVLNASAGTHVLSHWGVFRRVRATARDVAENLSPVAEARVR
jgi:hypothetical protein